MLTTLSSLGAFPHLQPKACPFTEDYSFFLRIAKQLARKPDAQPDIYVMTPPPLMDQAAYGMNKVGRAACLSAGDGDSGLGAAEQNIRNETRARELCELVERSAFLLACGLCPLLACSL